VASSCLLLLAAGLFAHDDDEKGKQPTDSAVENAAAKIREGQQTFRFDTFGDEAFWGDRLKLHQAIEGAALGGVGPGVSPRTALTVGLKVDVDALPPDLVQQLRRGEVNLDDPAVTVELLRLDAVVGLKGFFGGNTGRPVGGGARGFVGGNTALRSIGIQCALCHSTVDNSQPQFCPPGLQPNPGTGCVGRRLDGWANRDLNVGAIVALAPDLSAFTSLLGVDADTVKRVLLGWGPGKFDAELILDGKGFRPDGRSAATLLPPAFGLAGVNLHTWTGWGSIPHWNAFVANLEMHGQGRFFDPRLNNAAQFPIAAAQGFADVKVDPNADRITAKLPALHLYQLSIPSPEPPPGSFNPEAAMRGGELFTGKAKCNNCHVKPLWTEPGWNMHLPAEVCIDAFQADRAPDRRYRTAPLGALFTHTKGGFYHDGRFATLSEVVNHYNACLSLGLTEAERNDLIQYLLSLRF
jgi:hypothetical protein